jgi:hypothetical protein
MRAFHGGRTLSDGAAGPLCVAHGSQVPDMGAEPSGSEWPTADGPLSSDRLVGTEGPLLT